MFGIQEPLEMATCEQDLRQVGLVPATSSDPKCRRELALKMDGQMKQKAIIALHPEFS